MAWSGLPVAKFVKLQIASYLNSFGEFSNKFTNSGTIFKSIISWIGGTGSIDNNFLIPINPLNLSSIFWEWNKFIILLKSDGCISSDVNFSYISFGIDNEFNKLVFDSLLVFLCKRFWRNILFLLSWLKDSSWVNVVSFIFE